MPITTPRDELRNAIEAASNAIDVAIDALHSKSALNGDIDGDTREILIDEVCAINKRLCVVAMACGFRCQKPREG